MLLAKLYLNAEVYTGTPQYAQALAAAQQVIAGPFTLDPSYRHLFQADNNTSPEIIFPIIQDGLRTQTWGGTTFLIHASCGGTMNAGDYGVDGCWCGLRLKPEAYNRYAPGRPAGVVLLDRRPDGGRQQHQQLQQRHRGAQVHQQDQHWERNGSDLDSSPTPTSRCSGSATRTSSTPRPTCGAAAATGRRRWPT